jgi:Carboxypeptidase regulatory-like domain
MDSESQRRSGKVRRSASIAQSLLNNVIFAVLACFGLLLMTPVASGQSTGAGTISGTVTDPTGAVLPGAKVVVTNTATNVENASVTNATGYFEVDALLPGPYRIQVTSSGFETLVRTGITLEANAHLDIPAQLAPGRSVQSVVVNADASLLNTESGSSGQVLTTRQLEELPVSGSSPTWLAIIAPGVQGTVGQAASTGDTGGLLWTGLTQDFGTFGQIGVNEFSLDGAPNETSLRASGINLSPDEVGEMKFDVTGYDATVGHTMGVYVTQTTKAGTNNLHGAVRETYTPQRWGALNHFSGLNYRYQQAIHGCSNGPSTSPECYAIENQYGNPGTHANDGDAALGGPVVIPHLFDGRDKFFFFVSVVDDVQAGSQSQTASIPTMQERSGDFSDLPQQTANIPATFASNCPAGTPYFGQYQIYNPYSVVLNSNGVPQRTPFCGNVIPSSYMANGAMAKLYNSLMPVPTQNSPTGNNYTFTQLTPQTFRSYGTREDYKITAKDSVFVRYTRQNYTKSQNDLTVGNVGKQEGPRWIDVASIGWDHIINDRTNVDVTFGGTNYKSRCCYYPGFDAYSPSQVGLPSYTDQYATSVNPALLELPVMNIASYENTNPGEAATSLGQTDNVATTTRDFALEGNVTRVQGHHTIHAGAEWRQQNLSAGVGGNASGTYTFDDTYTQQNNGTNNTYPATTTGLSYAAFLMGINTSASASRVSPESLQSPYYAAYAGDTWRVTRKLTILPGLRFEYESGVVEKHNQLVVGWNPTADLSAISGPANAAYQSVLTSATAAQRAALPSSLVIQGGPEYAGVNGAPRGMWNNSYRFLPRLAATYALNSRVVLRGGYGLFYDTLNALNATIDQDGFSASTTVPSSTTFGTNFTPGVSPLSDPFPANASGARFNQPVGSAAGSYYYLGDDPTTLYDHNVAPARQQRASIGAQIQFGASTMLDVSYNVAYTSHISLAKNLAFAPASFYIGGQQPNTATSSLLATQVTNPFALSNFSGVAATNPAAYNLMSLNSYFTQRLINISNLVTPYPQMGGISEYQDLGKSHFQELLFNLTRRYSHGLTFMATFQINDQHDRDYFANAFDALPSWEPTIYSQPTRFTAEAVWNLPFGRGNPWARSGWESAVFGGYQLSASYEAQPGMLSTFSNLFYLGKIDGSVIKLKHPVYHNDQASGGSNYVQWLNLGNVVASATTGADGSTSCTYSGTGFVTNPACQPTAYNLRVFPTRVNGVRQMGMNGMNANISRNFHVLERLNLETTMQVYNLFNHQVLGGVNTTPTSGQFGEVTTDGWPNSSGRWLAVQGRLRF